MEEHVTDSAICSKNGINGKRLTRQAFAGSSWEWGLCFRSRGGLRLSLVGWRNRYVCRQDRSLYRMDCRVAGVFVSETLCEQSVKHRVTYTLLTALILGVAFKALDAWTLGYKANQQAGLSKKDILDTIKDGLSGGAKLSEHLETKVLRKGEQPRQETKPEATKREDKSTRPKQQKTVKIHFKESPLLTEQRRHVIQNEIDGFYEYLSAIGFQVPKELPPLGVRNVVSETIVTHGTRYDEQVNLPEDGLDNPEVIRRVYANHVFRRMFLTGNREPFGPFGGPTPSIFTDYYVSSFKGENSNRGDDSKWAQAKWVNAVWDIRTEYSQDFSDRLLFYVKEQWLMPKPTDRDFDRFFMQRFLAGLFVIDNAGQNESRIREILRKRGIQ
jgi:hypothetical protein